MAGEWTDTRHFDTNTRSFLQQLPKIQAVILHLQRKGRNQSTIDPYRKGLVILARQANLDNPKEVELAISNYKKQNGEPATNAWKAQLCIMYQHYCKYHNIKWEKPTYKLQPKSIQIPTHEKCNMLMASAHGTLSLKLDIAIQTGLRPCEICGEFGLKAEDIHFEQRTITPRSAKYCNPRPPIPITPELTTRLQNYIIKNNIQPKDRLFKGKTRNFGDHFRRFKKRLAKKLADPTILSIRLYDLRHAYITNLLRKLQNPEIVRQKVGHKRLNTTQKYFHLTDNNGEWIVEATTDKERAKQLLQQDFTYVMTTPDGTMLFRKPK